jgi:hypothetical protein
MCCAVLYCTVLYHPILYCTRLYSNVMYGTLYRTVLILVVFVLTLVLLVFPPYTLFSPMKYWHLLRIKKIDVIFTVFCEYWWRDPGAPEQLIVVERLELPPPEERRRASVMLDVMEVREWRWRYGTGCVWEWGCHDERLRCGAVLYRIVPCICIMSYHAISSHITLPFTVDLYYSFFYFPILFSFFHFSFFIFHFSFLFLFSR